MAKVRMGAITSNKPPKTRLSSRVGSYSQIAVAFSTAAIFVTRFIMLTFPRLTTCPKHLMLNEENLRRQTWSVKINKLTVIVIVPYFILEDLGGNEWLELLHRSCRCYWYCQALLYKAAKTGSTTTIVDTTNHTFNWSLLIIPTRSNNPTACLPKFSLLCSPDISLNPITSARNFHFLSFTSIQWAVIPINPILVVSADCASEVIEIFPGAAFQHML